MENGSESYDEGNEENQVTVDIDRNVKALIKDFREVEKAFERHVIFDRGKGTYNFGKRIGDNIIFRSVFWSIAELRNTLSSYKLENEVELSAKLLEVLTTMQAIFGGCAQKDNLKTELNNSIRILEELEQFEV